MIKLRFTTNPTSPISWAIRRLTWSKFSHVEFVLPCGLLGAHMKGGVLCRPVDYDLKCQFRYATVDCPPEVAARVRQIAEDQLKKPYDMTAIWGVLFHRDWKQDHAWYCSELVAYCFEQAGYPLVNDADGAVNRITPRDLSMSPLVRFD